MTRYILRGESITNLNPKNQTDADVESYFEIKNNKHDQNLFLSKSCKTQRNVFGLIFLFRLPSVPMRHGGCYQNDTIMTFVSCLN